MVPPGAATLNAVRFYNRISGWAAGTGGVMERYDRGAWQNAPSGTDEDLFGLTVLGNGDAWAVGDTGTILSYRLHVMDADQTAPVPSWQSDLPCIRTCDEMASAQEHVDFDLPQGAVYVAGHLSVAVSPADIVCDQTVAAGGTCPLPKAESDAKCASGPNQMTITVAPAGGSPTTVCRNVPTSLPLGSATAPHHPAFGWMAWARSPELGWTAGEPPDGTPAPLIIRITVADSFAGTTVNLKYRYRQMSRTWKPDPLSGTLTLLPLHAVAFLNPDNGWAVGGSPAQGGVALHYDGATWVSATVVDQPLYDLALVASDFIWFCGGNRRLMKFDGTMFTVDPGPVPYPDGLTWRAIAFPYRSLGWVVGDNGTVAQFRASTGQWNGTGPAGTITTQPLLGLSLIADQAAGYAVGAQGARVLVGPAPPVLETSGGEDLRSIHLINDLEGGAVGGTSRGRILMRRATASESALDRVRVWPNPFDPGRGQAVTLDRLPGDVSAIEIFTLTGERVATLGQEVSYDATTGIARWSGRIHGHPAASGTYPYRARTRSGKTGRGLILVRRR